jgi:hypothetical protein
MTLGRVSRRQAVPVGTRGRQLFSAAGRHPKEPGAWNPPMFAFASRGNARSTSLPSFAHASAGALRLWRKRGRCAAVPSRRPRRARSSSRRVEPTHGKSLKWFSSRTGRGTPNLRRLSAKISSFRKAPIGRALSGFRQHRHLGGQGEGVGKSRCRGRWPALRCIAGWARRSRFLARFSAITGQTQNLVLKSNVAESTSELASVNQGSTGSPKRAEFIAARRDEYRQGYAGHLQAGPDLACQGGGVQAQRSACAGDADRRRGLSKF